MRRVTHGWMILAVAVAVLVAGCGGGGGQAAEEARQARLDALRQAKSELDALRQELADAKVALDQALAAEGETPAEGEVPVDTAALAARIDQLEIQATEKADSFGSELVGFINENPPIVGEPVSEVQKAALGMKSEEDVALAQTYIDEGGDYARAIQIYKDALAADPGNPVVEAALARAEELRYMTPDRFAAVTKGMSQREVRAALGQVNLRNIREYPDREVVAWFYPTGEGGAAAGVFFRKERRSDDLVVYQTNFEAVPARGGEVTPE